MTLSVKKAKKAVGFLASLLGGRRGPPARATKAYRADFRRVAPLPWGRNIVGIAIGAKRSGPQQTPVGKLSVKFYVLRKASESRVAARERIPKTLTFESLGIENALTDVEVLGGIPRAHAGIGALPALSPGTQIGHFQGSSGSVGLIVRRRTVPGVPLVLSCSHVLAFSGFASPRDPIESPIDADTTRAIHQVGALDDFERLSSSSCSLDAAIGSIDPARAAALADVPGLGRPSGTRELTAAELRSGSGVEVVRVGATSGEQTGTISGAVGCFRVSELPGFGSQTVPVANLVPYRTFSQAGDSGAPVLESGTTTVLGLHVAGNGTRGFFQLVDPALARFDLILWDGP